MWVLVRLPLNIVALGNPRSAGRDMAQDALQDAIAGWLGRSKRRGEGRNLDEFAVSANTAVATAGFKPKVLWI
jgi:hypothetical protein